MDPYKALLYKHSQVHAAKFVDDAGAHAGLLVVCQVPRYIPS